jgi:iron-sulfur cluster insertion protein
MNETLKITDNAAKRIAAMIAKEQAEDLMLRVSVDGGGCNGFQYIFDLDATRNDDDQIFEKNGIRVVSDEASLSLLAGSELDFIEDLVGSYFAVKNPNATSSCGCGTSFSA